MSKYKTGIDVEPKGLDSEKSNPKEKRFTLSDFIYAVIITALGSFLGYSGWKLMPLYFRKGLIGLGLVLWGLNLIILVMRGGERR